MSTRSPSWTWRMEKADAEQETRIDPTAVQAAIAKLRQHPEPEARFMRTASGATPAYNVQTAVDAQHALIVTHQVTVEVSDNRSLEPMVQAARAALDPIAPINIVADWGYSNGEQARRCEAAGLIPHVPANRGINNHGDGTLFDRTVSTYQPETDTYVCPAGKTLGRKQLSRKDRAVYYQARTEDCTGCSLKTRCTDRPQRLVLRHLAEEALNRMHGRATPALMRLRRSTVEHPFATLKYRIFGLASCFADVSALRRR